MGRDWRCARCRMLLGIVDGDRLHIRFARGHQYIVGIPATSVCRGCGTMNEIALPRGRDPSAQLKTQITN